MDRSASPPKQCSSYRSGHTVHWIQALHVANEPEVEARTRWGVIQSISGEVIEVRFDEGDVVRYRNHEAGRMSVVAGGSGRSVSTTSTCCCGQAGPASASLGTRDGLSSLAPPMTWPAPTPPGWPNGCTRTAGSPPHSTMADPLSRVLIDDRSSVGARPCVVHRTMGGPPASTHQVRRPDAL